MSLIAKQPPGILPIPGDTYQAICYSLIELGTQHSEKYQKDIPQVMIGWEIPEVRIDIERDGVMVNLPRVISKTYTNSLGEKANLYADLISWRGKEFTQKELEAFDLRNILGSNCLLGVINKLNQKGKTIAVISSVSKLVKGMSIAKPENPIISFDMDADGIVNIPEALPDWIKDQIKNSVEYKAVMHAKENPALKTAQDAVGLNDTNDVSGDEGTEGDSDIPF